jgi:voltage-gated potassium channel
VNQKFSRKSILLKILARRLLLEFSFRLKLLQNITRLKEIRSLGYAALAVCTVIIAGAAGYVIIEGWNWFDAVYMTVITIFSVGYGETHTLTTKGRAFTILIIMVGAATAGFVLAIIGHIILERDLVRLFGGKKMKTLVDKLEGHTIFCGYGRLSKIAASELTDDRNKLVIIEKDEERARSAIADGLLVVRGEASDEEVLLQAGVKRAKRLVTLLPKDADNLYVILTSRELNSALFIMSRAEDLAGEKRLLRAGADNVVSPYRLGGHKIAEKLKKPYVDNFLELVVQGSHGELEIEEIKIPEASSITGLTFAEAEIRKKTNTIVAAMINKEGEMLFNPTGETIIEEGATLIVLGLKSDYPKLEKLLAPQPTT